MFIYVVLVDSYDMFIYVGLIDSYDMYSHKPKTYLLHSFDTLSLVSQRDSCDMNIFTQTKHNCITGLVI